MPVTKTRTQWNSGVLEFTDSSGTVIFGIDGPNRKVILPSGSTLELASGALFTGTLLFDAADVAALAITEPKRGISVRNETGSTIGVDKLVAISGFDVTTGLPKIVLADADAGLPAIGVTVAAILTAASGVIATWALSTADLNTNSATTAGDPVYASGTAGGFSHTAPTGVNARTQIVGWVVVKSATVGQILWFPQQPYTVGTASYQALSVDAAAIAASAVETAKIAAGALSADAAGRGKMAADYFGDVATVDDKFAVGTIGEDLLTANEVTGRAVANGSNANVIGTIPVLHRIVIAAGALGDTDVVLTHKTRVINAWLVLTGAGVATTTLTVKNGATAITDAMAASGSDKAIVRAATIDDAQHEIAAAGTLRVTSLTGATQPDAIVYVLGERVA